MKREHFEQLLSAVRSDPAVYRKLLREPEATADALGILLDRRVIDALLRSEGAIKALGREHDELQGLTEKFCIFLPMFAALPTKRKGKLPKPPKPRKERKTS